MSAGAIKNHSGSTSSVADLLRGVYTPSKYAPAIPPFAALRRPDWVLEPT